MDVRDTVDAGVSAARRSVVGTKGILGLDLLPDRLRYFLRGDAALIGEASAYSRLAAEAGILVVVIGDMGFGGSSRWFYASYNEVGGFFRSSRGTRKSALHAALTDIKPGQRYILVDEKWSPAEERWVTTRVHGTLTKTVSR